MPGAALPRWIRPLLSAPAESRTRHARSVLSSGRPWDDVRAALATAVRVEPAKAAVALSALRAEAHAQRDVPSTARLRVLEARAVHRSGRLDDALDAYADADRLLRRAGLRDEALALVVARVDALATSGRVAAAIALATRFRRAVDTAKSPRLSGSLDVNLGNALRLAGRLEEAARAYARAERVLARAGALDAAAVARVDRGVALVEAGDVDAARALFADGVEAFAKRGLVDLARETRTNLAHADLQSGRVGEAVRALESLAAEHRDAGLPRREGLARLDLALALLRAGDRAAAEREALRAAVAFGHATARAEQAEAWWVAAAAAGDEAGRAARHVASARKAARACGRPGVLLRCDLLAADAALRVGKPLRADSLSRLSVRARALGQPAVAVDADLFAGTLALASGRSREAARRFRAAAAASRARPWAAAEAEAGLAAVEARSPATRDRAIARLSRLVERLRAVRAGLPGRWLRATFSAERLEPSLLLARALLDRGRPSDRAEAERVLDDLARARFAAGRPPRAASRRLVRARRRLEALYDRLARAEGPARGAESGPISAIERRARVWERAVAAQWRKDDRAKAGPDPEIGSARRAPAAEAVVWIWRMGDELHALARAPGVEPSWTSLGDARDLHALSAALRLRARRWTLSPSGLATSGDAEAAERLLENVAARTLVPLRAETWRGRVAIIAGDGVPDLPWELLPLRGDRLGERCAVLRAPCASQLGATGPVGEGAVVVGVGDPGLAHVGAEVDAVAEASNASRVLRAGDATRAAVLDALATSRVVHVAGHGWDASEAPPLGGVRVADGWLCAVDLADRSVACDLVVLAACRTGVPAGHRTAPWGGLVPALLLAGARRVVWTTDDVDDRATADLMGRFHRARATDDGDRALGEALAASAREEGTAAPALPFRLSGVLS